MECNMNEVEIGVMSYLFGGNAEFNLVQDGSMSVRYRIKANDNRTCFFVYTESTKTKKLVYHGHIVSRNLTYHRGNKISDDEYNKVAIKALGWLLNHHNCLPNVVHVVHNGRCSRCGRKLTDPESLRTGIGPTCRKKSK